MAAFDYSRAKATAERLIARFGKSGSIRRRTSTGDEWDPTRTLTDYDATLVVIDYSLSERSGTLIGATDRKVLISTAGLTITPTNADKLVVDGDEHEIVRIVPLEPGATVVMWEAQVTF